MKKSTKSAKPAAPQVKSVIPKPVEPKPVKKTAVAPRKQAAPKAPVAAPAQAATAATFASPAPAKSSRPSTMITAKIDIGFGNALFVRGDGPGLSWDRGVAMDCMNDDTWSLVLPAGDYEVIFKFLVNDLSWSMGGDYVVASGKSVELTPTF